MALNFTPQDVGSGYSSEAVLDENFDNIQTALADGLSRSGNTPNAMGATLDMNSNRIINLPAPQSSNDAARYADILNGVETSDAVLPAQAGNTTRFLSTDGTNWVFKDIMDDEDLYDISLTDSEARTLKGKLDEVISVKDFGATGDGVTDDSTALTAAFTAGAWFFPKGTYKVSSDITLTGFKMFAPGASISVDSGQVVTLNGPIIAGEEHIFAGDGNYTINSDQTLRCEWVGVLDSNSAATNKTNWDKWLLRVGETDACAIHFGPYTYPFSAPFYVRQRFTITGEGMFATTIDLSGSDVHGVEFCYYDGSSLTTDTTIDSSPVHSTIKGIYFDCRDMTFTGGAKRAMCYAVAASSCFIQNNRFNCADDATNQMDGVLLVPSRADANGSNHKATLRCTVSDNRITNARDGIVLGRRDNTWSTSEPATGGAADYVGGDCYEQDVYGNYIAASSETEAYGRKGIVLNYYDYTAGTVSSARAKPYGINIRDNSVLMGYGTNLTGTVAINNGSTTLTGTGTAFTSEIPTPGSYHLVSVRFSDGSQQYNLRVSSVDSDTQLTLTDSFDGTNTSGANCILHSGIAIDNSSIGSNITIIGNYCDYGVYSVRNSSNAVSSIIFSNYSGGSPRSALNDVSADNSGSFFIRKSVTTSGPHAQTAEMAFKGMTKTTGLALAHDDTSTELTIAGGAITVTNSFHIVDTQSDASSDDLDTINGGEPGQILILTAANAARTVVLKDATDNLRLNGDFSLTSGSDTITLFNEPVSGNWYELSRSDNAT